MKGYSSQVKLFPVAFESGQGVHLLMLMAINILIFHQEFMLQILGHCHPKVVEYIQKYIGQVDELP